MIVPQRFPWICIIVNIDLAFTSVYFLALDLIAYVIPAIIVVTMYIKIILFLRHHLVYNRQRQWQTSHFNRERHIRLLKMFILLTSIFILFSSLLFSLLLIVAFTGKSASQFLVSRNPRSAILAELGFLLTVLSCLQNPILYFAFNPSFRQALYLKCQRVSCSTGRRNFRLGIVIEPVPNIPDYEAER